MDHFQTSWSSFVNLITNHFVITGCFATLGGYWLLRRLYAPGMCRCTARLDGKTVIITGANSGLGKETASNLASRGARVILACRDLARAESVAQCIRHESGNANVTTRKLDLASFQSIREFARATMLEEDRLDVLMNNAGVMACPKGRTEDGYETHFAVNHLGHFLLTNLLLELLKKTDASRIVNLTSFVHKGGSMLWSDLNHEKNYVPLKAYTQSKLANVLFTKALYKRLKGTTVTTYAANPGIVKTSLDRHLHSNWLQSTLVNLAFVLVCKTPWEGAQTQIYCAVSPELAKESGQYYSDCKAVQPGSLACSEEDADQLWNISLNLTGLTENS